jgi:hypothetical protein
MIFPMYDAIRDLQTSRISFTVTKFTGRGVQLTFLCSNRW